MPGLSSLFARFTFRPKPAFPAERDHLAVMRLLVQSSFHHLVRAMAHTRLLGTTLTAVAVMATILPMQPAMATAEADNLYLEMDLSQLMQVTVTSVGKKPQTLANTPAAVYVISQEDIRRSGATSIPEVLAMAPGIQVSQISSSKWSVSSRGFGGYTSSKLLVLIDGRSAAVPTPSKAPCSNAG